MTNRLEDVLAHTSGLDPLAKSAWLLDSASPKPDPLRRHQRAGMPRLPRLDQVADERAFHVSLGTQRSEQLTSFIDLVALHSSNARTELWYYVSNDTTHPPQTF